MAGRRHKSPPSGTSRKNRHETHDSTASVDLPYLPHDFFGNPPSNQPPDFDKKQASLIQKMPTNVETHDNNHGMPRNSHSIGKGQGKPNPPNINTKRRQSRKGNPIPPPRQNKLNIIGQQSVQTNNNNNNNNGIIDSTKWKEEYSGYMFKQGVLNANYKKRYFKLFSNKHIQYFDKENSQLKGTINLDCKLSLIKRSQYS